MTKAYLTFLSLAAVTWAQPAIAPPQLGSIVDSGNSLRPVYGIAGNFVLGDTTATGVDSAAFSGSFGLGKTDSAVIATDRQGRVIASLAAAAGPALFAFSRSGAPALAYLAGTGILLAWDGQTFQSVLLPPDFSGAVTMLSIASPDARHAVAIVQRDDGLWEVRLLLATGEVVSQRAILGVTAPLLMLATGSLVYSDASGIVVRKTDGSESHIAARLPANFAFQQMGDGWIQVRDLDNGSQFAVCVTEGREQFYELPGVSQ